MKPDRALPHPALVEALAAWGSALARSEAEALRELVELDQRAEVEDVDAGRALVDHIRRRELLAEVERVRREREDLAALCSSWTCRPWPAPPRHDHPQPNGDRR